MGSGRLQQGWEEGALATKPRTTLPGAGPGTSHTSALLLLLGDTAPHAGSGRQAGAVI